MRHRRGGSFGRSARSAGFDSTSSSRFAVEKIACRSDTSRLIVAAPYSSVREATYPATSRGRIAASGVLPKWSTSRARIVRY
jgi:hypothetical protein